MRGERERDGKRFALVAEVRILLVTEEGGALPYGESGAARANLCSKLGPSLSGETGKTGSLFVLSEITELHHVTKVSSSGPAHSPSLRKVFLYQALCVYTYWMELQQLLLLSIFLLAFPSL